MKTTLSGQNIIIDFDIDTKVKCNVRVSACVTEEKNENNVPVMFYTPNREDYVVSQDYDPGLKMNTNGRISFK